MVFSYTTVRTTLADSGEIANIIFSGDNLGFYSAAPSKAYDLEITFDDGALVKTEPNVHLGVSDPLIVQVNDLDYFSNTSVLIRYKNTTDSNATGTDIYAMNNISFTANGADPSNHRNTCASET